MEGELLAFVEELRARHSVGGDVLDADAALAAVEATVLRRRTDERAETLFDLVSWIDEHASDAAQDPDLALATALGWLALMETPLVQQLPTEERVASLEKAVTTAEHIDTADRRDSLGCALVEHLSRQFEPTAPERLRELEHGIETFSSDVLIRPYLLCFLADGLRLQRAWDHAWRCLVEAEEMIRRERALDTRRADLELLSATVLCLLEIDWGLADRALDTRARIHELVGSKSLDFESEMKVLQVDSGTAMLVAEPALLQSAIARLGRTLSDVALFDGRPGAHAEIEARRAVLQYELECAQPAEEVHAEDWLATALADSHLDPTWSFALTALLTRMAFVRGDLEGASRRLTSFEERGGAGGLTPLHVAILAAWRARLDLARGAPREVLLLHYSALKRMHSELSDAWGNAPRREGGLGSLGSRHYHTFLGALIELALELEGPRQAAELFFAHQAEGSLARQLGASKSSLLEVQQELLKPGVGLLLFVPSDIRTHFFVIDAQGIEAFQLSRGEPFAVKLRALNALLAESPALQSAARREQDLRRISSLSAEIGQWLLPPEVRKCMAGWRGAYLSGADVLGDIPFESLPYGDRDLGRELGLATLPSIPVALQLARRPRVGSERELLLVTEPSIPADVLQRRPNLANLPVGEQAQTLMRPFRRADSLRGRDANWARIEAEIKRSPPSILHLLVHGVTDLGRELGAGLALANSETDEDGLLWCEDVTAGAPLVILSACSSARGPQRIGDDGLAQLGGVFMKHGTRCTLQATREIALEPTLQLMAVLSARLAEGDPPAEAHRFASVELGRSERYSHPFYLHAMRVVGLGWEPVLDPASAGR